VKKRLKLLVVDDHPVVRSGIKMFLSKYDDLEVIGEAENGQEAVWKARKLRPDVVLLDIEMPYMDGFAAARVLDAELPEVRVLVLADRGGVESVTRAIESGGRGYVLKARPLHELLLAIERVGAGHVFFPPESTGIGQTRPGLSPTKQS
jgi:two-component system response regulator NreC